MRTDNNIDFTVGQIFQHLSCRLGRARPAQIVDPAGHPLQTFRESLVVLERQHRSRNQHSNLLVVGNCLVGGTDGNFGFTEAHIATNKAVHRLVLLHILLHVGRSLQLVGRIFVNERRLQFLL